MARRVTHRRQQGLNLGTILGVVLALALVGGAVYLVKSNKNQPEGIVSDAFATIGGVVNAPINWVRNSAGFISSYFVGAEEVRRLRRENQALLEWRDSARAIAEKLATYEKLNNIQSENVAKVLTGRMIAETNGPFSRSGIVNVGSLQGAAANWVAVNQFGYVGRIVSVDKNSSRVLLATDSDSRISIMGEETRARAIMIGDKTDAPILEHLSIPAGIKRGERILTSGDDGIIPRGIAIGIADIGPDGKWRVKLNTNAAAIDYVKLISPNFIPAPNDRTNGLDFGAPVPSSETTIGAIMPLDAGSAQVPVASTPQAIAQAQELRKVKEELAAAKKQKSDTELKKPEPVGEEVNLPKAEPKIEPKTEPKPVPKEVAPKTDVPANEKPSPGNQ